MPKTMLDIKEMPTYKPLMCDEAWRLLADFVGDRTNFPSTRYNSDTQRFENFIEHIVRHDRRLSPRKLHEIVCGELKWTDWLLLDFERNLPLDLMANWAKQN